VLFGETSPVKKNSLLVSPICCVLQVGFAILVVVVVVIDDDDGLVFCCLSFAIT
jgi:hypothetical protein